MNNKSIFIRFSIFRTLLFIDIIKYLDVHLFFMLEKPISIYVIELSLNIVSMWVFVFTVCIRNDLFKEKFKDSSNKLLEQNKFPRTDDRCRHTWPELR